ncbi:hypothetical protein [Streptomyces halobius]|uniref:SUKH-4 immunity protein of toxin-antitoxin system n=1 Tax=Streptomyces halobius TaxID=2879846 RepID=A0ABY4M133_9ACTN|nr:hypothetical protein [Streptomyces halobius]UQA91425.1 hypothetical protein K9S39_05620 [Streptomyces halobius]
MTREDLTELTTTFYVAAPEGKPWGLDGEQFAIGLRQLSTQAVTAPLRTSQDMTEQLAFDGHSTMFAVHVGDVPIDGQFMEASQSLNIGPCTAAEAAAFIEWFQNLLPEGARLRFNSEKGVESGDMEDYWIPAGARCDAIAKELLNHLDEAVDE